MKRSMLLMMALGLAWGLNGSWAAAETEAAPVASPAWQAQEGGTETTSSESTEDMEFESGYRGISSLFNVREANSNVPQGKWEFEFTFEWFTSSGEDDELELEQSLKYGITDAFHIELEVMEPELGDGGRNGAGETRLTLFYQLLQEQEAMPALGIYASGRFPSGHGSSGVDGTFGAAVTKSIDERFRVHFEGFLQTANGEIGSGDDGGRRGWCGLGVEDGNDRRDFQWGLGPGFDYMIDDATVAGLNYLHRAGPYYGERDQNILELLLVRDLGSLGPAQHELKLAMDVGLDGVESTPNFGAKIQWAIEW